MTVKKQNSVHYNYHMNEILSEDVEKPIGIQVAG